MVLKPANVILSPRAGRPNFIKLLDFGLARGGDDGTGDTTRSGAIIGTPAYMSPEHAKAQGLDRRADIWSAGVVLWEVLAGRRMYPPGDDIGWFRCWHFI